MIYDCGQNGIVGHMGCVFSRIYHNHIYNIAVKHEYFGHEIAGIKLHAAIDVQICNNNIHNCSLGTWLDWQAPRVSGNLYYGNDRDFMIEVTHGPCLIDHNIFASAYSIDNYAQGTAFVHNLQCGGMHREAVLKRATPYHFPHTTEAAGTAVVYGADDRFYQNIFLGGTKLPYEAAVFDGTADYNECPENLEVYLEEVIRKEYGDLEDHLYTNQPAYVNGNVYLRGADAYTAEKDNYVSVEDPGVKIVTEDGAVYLEMEVEQGVLNVNTEVIDTKRLGTVRIVEALYEDPEGNPVTLDRDYNGVLRGEHPVAGPLEELQEGYNRIKVWG